MMSWLESELYVNSKESESVNSSETLTSSDQATSLMANLELV
jgi:hypothetical protein